MHRIVFNSPLTLTGPPVVLRCWPLAVSPMGSLSINPELFHAPLKWYSRRWRMHPMSESTVKRHFRVGPVTYTVTVDYLPDLPNRFGKL